MENEGQTGEGRNRRTRNCTVKGKERIGKGVVDEGCRSRKGMIKIERERNRCKGKRNKGREKARGDRIKRKG